MTDSITPEDWEAIAATRAKSAPENSKSGITPLGAYPRAVAVRSIRPDLYRTAEPR
jgi:hypothetical protein